MAAPVLTILLFVFTEILPIMYVQDWAFMEIFVLKPEQATVVLPMNGSDLAAMEFDSS